MSASVGSRPEAHRAAAEAVKLPALGVVATGSLWLLLWAAGAVFSLAQMAGGVTEPGATPPALNLLVQLVFMAVAAVVIVGGLQMRRLRHRGLALTAAFLSLVCFY